MSNIEKFHIIELKDIGFSFLKCEKDKLLSHSLKTSLGREVANMLDSLNQEIGLKNKTWKEATEEKVRAKQLELTREKA